MPPNATGVTITNPLVLYRSLVATNRIKADPAQHRLALHLQKLYENLIDYEPTVEYSHRLQQLSRKLPASSQAQDVQSPPTPPSSQERLGIAKRSLWTSFLAAKIQRDSLALTRVLTSHESAMALNSPKGLMLHGEVGTGKSMLLDLFADCLPNRKKRRWHFSTFMLHTISQLEALRRSRLDLRHPGHDLSDEYSLLWLARDLIEKSPILFLDEFQLPDRAASKILSNLMTSFFQLGGVLVASSNRMPEELAKAAGMEFERPVSSLSRLGWSLGLSGGTERRDEGAGQKGEFAMFLEVLRARCEVWEMEGKNDYRRLSGGEDGVRQAVVGIKGGVGAVGVLPFQDWPDNDHELKTLEGNNAEDAEEKETTLPRFYLIEPAPTSSHDIRTSFASNVSAALMHATSRPDNSPDSWTPALLTVYGRKIPIPATYRGTALFTFEQLCGATLGPADYITLASTYHTIILTSVPVLTFLQKNEARRLITLLDALYEARCRLLVTAVAGPDDILFPTPPSISTPNAQDGTSGDASESEGLINDAVHPETFSEIHQDLTSPFRPNISSYTPSALSDDALEDDPPNRVRRPGSSFTDERKVDSKAPDFANIRGLTGEDETFAVKRAQSRLWEMTSGRWWNRGAELATDTNAEIDEDGGADTDKPSWWRPLPLENRHWEHQPQPPSNSPSPATRFPPSSVYSASTGRISRSVSSSNDTETEIRQTGIEDADMPEAHKDGLFRHGASPFRTASDPPPRISWTHVWGTVRWGKRAGAWGRGVEGLDERRKEKGDGKGETNDDEKWLGEEQQKRGG